MILTKVNPHPDEAYTNTADAAIITVLAAVKAIFIKNSTVYASASVFFIPKA